VTDKRAIELGIEALKEIQKKRGMTIDKAIKRLEGLYSRLNAYLGTSDDEAIKLGIEAMRECKKARDGNPALDGELLPGETEK